MITVYITNQCRRSREVMEYVYVFVFLYFLCMYMYMYMYFLYYNIYYAIPMVGLPD